MMVQLSAPIMTIKWKLYQLMFERRISNATLAEQTGFHPNTISKLKNLREMPDRLERNTLDKLCKALKVRPSDLLVYEAEEEDLGVGQ
jgi:putative transcriptional regulator